MKKHNKKKEILIYCPVIEIGGVATTLVKVSNYLCQYYDIKIFTIEHNYNKNKRNKIINIMKKNNYIRVHKNLSYMDDWFIKENLNE